ncbi:MAG: hypothetical protein V7K55_24465 [Nostoc sp.]|uniref:hypothetical protein n=1 Tax=Nostoc sp. TaxID=1180 RepID=UPI002FF96FEE
MTENTPKRPNVPSNVPTQQTEIFAPEPLGIGFHAYSLDRHAYDLVLRYCQDSQVINESHKMRIAVAYGLERFWGEHLRDDRNSAIDRNKRIYWCDVWKELAKIMLNAGIELPDRDCTISGNNVAGVREVTTKLCQMSLADTRATLAVLTQLCDSLVWWTQRLKQRDRSRNEK